MSSPAPRLALVTDAWEPQVNGVVRTLGATVSVLRAWGWSVRVIEPSLFRSLPSPYPGVRLAVPPYGMRAALDAALRDADPTCAFVHVSTEGPLGWASRAALRSSGRPFTTAHHTAFPALLRRWGIPEAATWAGLRRFHAASARVLVPTPAVATALRARGFARVEVWGRGVDRALFRPRPAEPSVLDGLPRPIWLSVGRVSAEKGIDRFLSLDLPGTKAVVGDGPDLEKLRARFPQAAFAGPLFGEALARAYAAADCFVFPSRFDTFGLVMAEAIASGTPVAAHPVTGPVDVVRDGVTGVLDGDLRAACLACLRLDRARVAAAGADFSWDAATDQFAALLEPAMVKSD